MEFGFFDHVERHGSDLGALYAQRLQILEYADRAGFYGYHVAEHHGTPLAMAPSPSLLLAAAAARTSRIRLGPLCYILPLYDPLRLYEEICMLDQLSGGRLEIGVGRGVSNIELNFFSVDSAESRDRFEEALEILELAFTSNALTYDGRWHSYDNVPIELRPAQLPRPRYWYPTSSATSAREVGAGSYETIFQGSAAHVASLVDAYREGAGGSLDPTRKVGVLRMIFLAPTAAEAREVGERAVRHHEDNLGHLANWSGADGQRIARVRNTTMPQSLDEAIEMGWAVVGTPSDVTEQLASLLADTGCNYLVFNPLLADVPFDFAMRAVRLFAEEVMPALR